MNALETEINKVLTKWNPIGVPLSIAEIEYTSYIPKIIEVYKERKSIYSYLVYIYTEAMGYDINKEAEEATKKANGQILQILDNVSL
jgi:hypothetical protein